MDEKKLYEALDRPSRQVAEGLDRKDLDQVIQNIKAIYPYKKKLVDWMHTCQSPALKEAVSDFSEALATMLRAALELDDELGEGRQESKV